MLLWDRVKAHSLPRTRGILRTLRGARAPRVPSRVRAVSGGVRGPSDDEERDRFGIYGFDMNPERAGRIVRSLNVTYHAKGEPMTREILRKLLVDK